MLLLALAAALLTPAPADASLKVVDVETGKRTIITRDAPPEGFTSMRWTPDGSALIAVANKAPGDLAVRRYPAAGGPAKPVRRLREALDAVLSPDRTRVAALYDYGQGLRGGTGGVVIRDLGTNRTLGKLPQSAEGDDLYESFLDLAWSRDGARVAYSARERRGQTLRIAEARTGRVLRRVDAGRISGVAAEAFSPAGDQLIYVSGSAGQLHALDIASGTSRRLGARGLFEAWAPAGNRIALSTGEGIMVSGEDQRFGPLVETAETASGVSWSPDGTQLAFVMRGHDWDDPTALAVMTPGSAPRILIPFGKSAIYGLEWSPDGTRLAYHD
ncbi:hypothetical protein OJ998_17630 [Solirubrobacter taibaiensis]|nr:hypothetical protein [Solirubrobacter taibaiensis]